jgi:tRNA (adenine22-N1)-methyltransferase
MGGELIARIIEDAPHLKAVGTRLILQPMTKQEHLRRHLALSGFSVLGERFSFDSGKYYVTLLAEYTGECREISECEAELGIDVPHNSDAAEYLGFLEGKRRAAKKALDGKRSGGYDTVDEEALLGMIDERISATKKI